MNEQMYYLRRDQQGSVTGLIDQNGNIVEEYSYDAWGRRRNTTTWTYDDISKPQYLYRGYTFHEHMDEFGLINMNGRAYDPIVGRFLNADPVIQNTSNTQNYDRYSYCLNNPLKYTDPSGYVSEGWQNKANMMMDMNRNLQMNFNNWYNSTLQMARTMYMNELKLSGANSLCGGSGGGFVLSSFIAQVAKMMSNYVKPIYGRSKGTSVILAKDGYSIYQDESSAYMKMWQNQIIKGLEQLAYIMEDGSAILVSDETASETEAAEMPQSLVDVFEKNDNGSFFNINGNSLRIIGIAHTHSTDFSCQPSRFNGDPTTCYDDCVAVSWEGIPIITIGGSDHCISGIYGGKDSTYNRAYIMDMSNMYMSCVLVGYQSLSRFLLDYQYKY